MEEVVPEDLVKDEWPWQDFDEDRSYYHPRGSGVIVASSTQTTHSADACETDRLFVPGAAFRLDDVERLRIDLGDGTVERPVPEGPGYLMNIVEGSMRRDFVGTCDIIFPAVKIDVLANLVSLSEASVEHIIRPLHDGLVSDEMVPKLSALMRDSAAEGRAYASLFLEQAMTSIALHIFETARGRDWAATPGLEWREDGALRARLVNNETLARLDDRRLRRAVEYLEAHIAEPLSVPDLAEVAALSTSHFAQSFKAATGESVWAYVQRRRLERARDLLRAGVLPIGAIARRCGFCDGSHLSRAIRRRYGKSPSDLRPPAVPRQGHG